MTAETADAVVAAAAVLADGVVLPDHAVAVSGGRIVWIGPADDARPLIGTRTDVWRHDGLLLPGFFDSHNHLLMTGMGMLQPGLGGCRSIADVLTVVGAAAAATAPGQWVITSPAWHESMLVEKRMPTADELDAVSDGHPVFLRRGGHNVALNSRALQVLDVERTSGEEPGTTVVRHPDGRPTGHVVGTAYVSRLAARLPAVPEERKRNALTVAGEAYARSGITSVVEPGLQPDDIELFRRLGEERFLPLRVRMMWRVVNSDRDIDQGVAAIRDGRGPTPFRDEWTSLFGLKVGVDGGVETGCYRDAYDHADDPEHPHGKPLISGTGLQALCEAAAPTRWHVGVHCVGDAAIDEVLAAFEAANRVRSLADRRWTLIHMMYPRPDHWPRARALGLTVTAQQPLQFALSAGFHHYIGAERARDIEPLRQYLAELRTPVGGGSDSPVAPFEPLIGIASSVSRATRSAGIVGPEWAISVEEAIRMYTESSAWCAFEEAHVGTLAVGRAADMTCLSSNIVESPEALADTAVVWTMAGGTVTYELA